ncbi:phage head closure protein [Clostridium sp. YIM B02505]|uniref:Phage head closure protein n=1 Tax=Clostridium yunnanense TaxID=2800325 RepID=A0ABS1EIF3_9CLOT|nr:phage head closure protein [Clostridium yunnanense]MBK1809141.1 phage head closure protein [Clostridium yunnanense]
MDNGKLNTRIKIEKRTAVYGGGKKTETWVDYYSCWCSVLDLIGQEKYSAYNSNLQNTIKLKCRACKELKEILFNTKDYRVVWDNKTLNIIFVDTMANSKTDIVLQMQKVN